MVAPVLFTSTTPMVDSTAPLSSVPSARSPAAEPKEYTAPLLLEPVPTLNRAFAPVPAVLAKLQPLRPEALTGAAFNANGPAPENVNVPVDGNVSKFWL